MNIEENKEQFEQVLEQVKKIEGLTTQEAVQVAIALLQEAGKDRRAELLGARFSNNGNGNLATPKQRSYLSRLGIKYSSNITKTEASELIDKARNSDTESGY